MAQTASRLKVWLDPITENMMQSAGFEMDHGIVKKGVFIISDFSPKERAWLNEHGVKYDVQINDVETYYATRMESVDRGSRVDCNSGTNVSYQTPDDFSLGSMGGFFTYQEFLDHLDNMAQKYPNLITSRVPIDTFQSHESRPIYWLKISDNPGMNENEPEVLYTSIHHAREPESLSQLIFFMYYLLENYGSDDEVTHLVDNTEMYFIPMINPDGYIRNQTTNPNGGGMWRKNRRDNGDGTFGVDLNRNYGYNWGLNNQGSSPVTDNETYRGPAPFSEPETQAVKWFCEQHDFIFALNYHSFGNYLIYPWGFQQYPLTPDSTEFIAFAENMCAYNEYTFGTGFETVGYSTNGDSDDWMYGEQNSKPKIFSMTPEVGNQGDGFWPASTRIIPLAEENVWPNLLMAHYAGDYLQLTDVSGSYINTINASVDVELTRLGLQFNGPYELEVIPVSNNISSVQSILPISNIAHLQTITEPVDMVLNSNIQTGDLVEFDLKVTTNGYSYSTRISKVFGSPAVVYNENGNGFSNFDSTSTWSTTNEDYFTANQSITDSPFDNYYPANQSFLIYDRVIDLRSAISAQLTFNGKWAIEAGWDYCQAQVALLDDENWQPLCGLYTKTGNQYQDQDQPVWDGFQNDWVQEQLDLNDYIGQRIKLRFRMVSDQFVEYDGYYIDDLQFEILLDENSTVPLDTGFVSRDSISGLTTAKEGDEISVFPNPAGDQITITNLTSEQIEVSVFNSLGAPVYSTSMSGRLNMNTSEWPAGIYYLVMTGSDGRNVQQIVVQH